MEITKEYLDEQLNKFASKDDLEYLKSRASGTDYKLSELIEAVELISKRDVEDSGALASILLDHESRLKFLEKLSKRRMNSSN